MSDIKQMKGTFTNWALDKFVAPKISKLNSFGIIDISVEFEAFEVWLNQFILNSNFVTRIPSSPKQYLFNYIKKVQFAFESYIKGSIYLDEYINGGNRQAISKYFKAINYFETCVAQAYQSYMLAMKFLEMNDLFVKGDGSDYDRLNKVYNTTKHIESRIKKGEMKEEATIGMWFTNDGLESVNASLSYKELFDMLVELGKFAEKIATIRPLDE